MKVYKGDYKGKDTKVSIVVSRFNDFITSKLLDGALDCLKRHGVSDDNIKVVWVPGTYEIPVTCKKLVEAGDKTIVALGAVIRGDTPHFDYIASEVAKGIAKVGMSTGLPVIFGVITSDTIEQAIERAGTKVGNKGADAAASAIEMTNLFDKLPKSGARKTARR